MHLCKSRVRSWPFQDEPLNAMMPPGICLAIIQILSYLKTKPRSQLSLKACIPQGFPNQSPGMWVRDDLLLALPYSFALASAAAQPVHAQTNHDHIDASV